MKIKSFFSFFFIPLFLSSCALNNETKPLNNRVIVAFNDDINHDNAISLLRNDISSFRIVNHFNEAFNGISIDINEDNLSLLQQLDFVSDVFENQKHYFADTYLSHAEEATSINLSALTMNKPSNSKEGEGVAIAVLDSSFYLEHECYSALDNATQIRYSQDSIQEIIKDTDFHGKRESATTNTTYYNNKVPFYYDYGGDITSKDEKPECDYDVYSSLSYHGHHVASIAAGNGQYKGIASNAQLLLMKVFTSYVPNDKEAREGQTPSIYCEDERLLLALEDAAILNVDIINMSLGSVLDDFPSDHLLDNIFTKLRNKNVLLSVSAGNDSRDLFSGSYGYYSHPSEVDSGYLGSIANHSANTAVASMSNGYIFYNNVIKVDDIKSLPYRDEVVNLFGSTTTQFFLNEHRLIDLISGTQNTFPYIRVPNIGQETDYNNIDVTNKIAVISRGENTFKDKVSIATSKGAIAVVIINNDPNDNTLSLSFDFDGYEPTLPVILLQTSSSSYFSESGQIAITPNSVIENESGLLISNFSSNGPTFELDLKPEISAPGNSILGAIYFDSFGRLSKNGYGELSGTSMAAPNYSGALALHLAEHLGDNSYRSSIEARMMNYAYLMLDRNKENYKSPRYQGAGVSNIAYETLNCPVYIEGYDAVLNRGTGKGKINIYNNDDISNGKISLTFLAHNSGSSIDYNYSLYVMAPKCEKLDIGDKKNQNAYGSLDSLIHKKQGSLTIPHGDNVIDMNDLYQLSDEEKSRLNEDFPQGTFIEGFLVLEKENEVTISIPYLGYYGIHDTVSPVEPFIFERDNSVIYPSDILNAKLHNDRYYYADYCSNIFYGHSTSLDIGIGSVLTNAKSFYSLGYQDASITSSEQGYIINAGNNSYYNTLVIQQYVTRSVKDNSLIIKNKTSGEVVLEDKMYNLTNNESVLIKSQIVEEYYSSGIYANRAYTIIPLYEGLDSRFKDGEYEIIFTYSLANNQMYTKSYTLIIKNGSSKQFIAIILVLSGLLIVSIVGLTSFISLRKKRRAI